MTKFLRHYRNLKKIKKIQKNNYKKKLINYIDNTVNWIWKTKNY